jgi:WD40 repeat protein
VWSNVREIASTGEAYLDALDVGSEIALVGGRDGLLRVIREGQLADKWPARFGPVAAVRLNADESWAVVGTTQGGCRIVRMPGGDPIASLPGHRGAVRAIALSGDDRWLVTGDEEGLLRVWQRSGKTFVLEWTLPFSGPIRTVKITPDRRRLIVLAEGETAVRVVEWAELERQFRQLGL